LNVVPDWAYGVVDWLELGAYVTVYSWTGNGQRLIDGAKLRAEFVVPQLAGYECASVTAPACNLARVVTPQRGYPSRSQRRTGPRAQGIRLRSGGPGSGYRPYGPGFPHRYVAPEGAAGEPTRSAPRRQERTPDSSRRRPICGLPEGTKKQPKNSCEMRKKPCR
jgi:hypothetical protein